MHARKSWTGIVFLLAGACLPCAAAERHGEFGFGYGQSKVDWFDDGWAIASFTGEVWDGDGVLGVAWGLDTAVTKNAVTWGWYSSEIVALNMQFIVEPHAQLGGGFRIYPRIGVGASHSTINDSDGEFDWGVVYGAGLAWSHKKITLAFNATQLTKERSALTLALRYRWAKD